MLFDISYFVYGCLNNLPYMAFRLHEDETVPLSKKQKQDVYKTIADIYETVYKNDDMEFEALRMMMFTHENIAELEAECKGDVEVVRKHLERAFDLVVKSANVKEHELDLPLLHGWHISASPTDNKQCIGFFKKDL